jgi:ABC-type transport system involved in multi-copper enzyme maturation permease subunit
MLGPLFRLELVTTARPPWVLALRAGYVSVLAWTLWASYQRLYDQGDIVTLQAVSRFAGAFFSNFAWLQLLVVVGLGPALVASAIAGDRERGILDHLFTTTLRNGEIVGGKLGVRLLHLTFVVLAGLPVLAAAMIMGGIAPESLAAVLLATLSTLLTVSAIALLLSVWSARMRPAVASAYLLIFGLLLLPLGMQAWRNASSWFQGFHDRWLAGAAALLREANPFWSLAGHLYGDATRQRDVLSGTLLLARSQLVVAAVCLVLAVLTLRKGHLATLDQGRGHRAWASGWRCSVWAKLPLAWKEMFAERATDRLGPLGKFTFALGALSLLAATASAFAAGISKGPSHYFEFSAGACNWLACFGLLWLVSRGASLVAAERERNTWDTLLSLPVSRGEIVLGKLAGNLYAARWLLGVLVVIWSLGAWFRPAQLLSTATAAALFLLVGWFGSAVGLLFSLAARNSLRALLGAVSTCLFVGGGYLMLFFPIARPGRTRSTDLLWSPCVPMLFEVAHEVGRSFATGRLLQGWVILALGTTTYAVAATLLTAVAVLAFERLTGRLEARASSARFSSGISGTRPSSRGAVERA